MTGGERRIAKPLLAVGQRVNEKLVVDRELGEGAFAEVYRVQHSHLGPQALKLFRDMVSREAASGMMHEVSILITLAHPHIIRVFDAGTVRTSAGRRGYMTMEYMPGGNLHALLRSHEWMVPVDEVVTVLRQAAEGLAVAHERTRPIVHRDLSLANVLITNDDTGLRAKVSDFGLARETDQLAMVASAQGTVAYMPPEVLRGGCGYSRAGDVWSLGTIAYHLLTNHYPYDGDDTAARSFSLERFNRPLLPPSAFNDDVDPALDRLVTDMLSVDPEGRPATAREVARRVAALAAPVEHAGASGERAGVSGEPAGAPAADPPAQPPAPAGGERAGRQLRALVALSREPGRLPDAADQLARLIDEHPDLARRHLPRLRMWRRGVVM